MNSKMIRVVLTAAACLGILVIPTTQSSSTSTEQEQGSNVLISNSGYMVAIG